MFLSGTCSWFNTSITSCLFVSTARHRTSTSSTLTVSIACTLPTIYFSTSWCITMIKITTIVGRVNCTTTERPCDSATASTRSYTFPTCNSVLITIIMCTSIASVVIFPTTCRCSTRFPPAVGTWWKFNDLGNPFPFIPTDSAVPCPMIYTTVVTIPFI